MLYRAVTTLLYLFIVGPQIVGAQAMAADESPTQQVAQEITVYKSPTCGCCAGWVDYLRDNGFDVMVVDRHDLSAIKAERGVGSALQSCHTGIVDGYTIEGHVPAHDIWRLLQDRPDASGLTAPGMPAMSPGMGSIEPQGYDVLLFGPDGSTSVYSKY